MASKTKKTQFDAVKTLETIESKFEMVQILNEKGRLLKTLLFLI
ncbi:hypothetical protein ACI2OX_14050 [Bacillus sp. N9]